MRLQEVYFFVYVEVLGAQQQLILIFEQMRQIWHEVVYLAVMTVSFDEDVSCDSAMWFPIHPLLHFLWGEVVLINFNVT